MTAEHTIKPKTGIAATALAGCLDRHFKAVHLSTVSVTSLRIPDDIESPFHPELVKWRTVPPCSLTEKTP